MSSHNVRLGNCTICGNLADNDYLCGECTTHESSQCGDLYLALMCIQGETMSTRSLATYLRKNVKGADGAIVYTTKKDGNFKIDGCKTYLTLRQVAGFVVQAKAHKGDGYVDLDKLAQWAERKLSKK